MSSSSSGAFPPAFLPGLGHAVEHQTAQNIEDFEAQMAAARTLLPADDDLDEAPPPAYSRTASNNAGGGNSSNAGRASPLPPPSTSLFSSNAQGDNNNNTPGLQAGRAWSSESVATFNNLCLKNAVANAFDYEQCRPMPPGWAVRLTFSFFGGTLDAPSSEDDGENNFEIRLPGPYGSKKEAKAAAAERGLGVLGKAIVERREKRGAGGKRKKPAAAGSEDGEIREGREGEEREGESEGEEELAENWVGLLGEFTLGANYSMECIMPSEEGRGPDEPFGGRNVLFNSKKTAKTNAAREAVRWLRQTGRMPKTGHPTKKKMKAAQQAMAAAANNASASAPFSFASSASGGMSGPLPTPVPIGGGGGTASGSESDGGGNSSSSSAGGPPGFKDRSLGEQVMILCKTLGCAQPIYKIAPDPRVPSMWSGAAYFPHDPAVAAGVVGQSSTAVGEVRNVYGKKKAREEVAKKVLKHLKGMQAERQKVVDGVLGVGAGVGAPGGGGK
ncbi:putative double-stranded rna-binding protein [Diplodia seriata]|uniref:Putative double-stranded rna-binding protein n=1 Tax=Diplodia seriata TaxID=420778 RepID=A0A0G2GMF4_9PEZI|nr:putative double-stranded rna-binding protein [Diplodia seriata]